MEKIKTLDWNKWLKNTTIFGAPFLLVFLVAIQSGVPFKSALFTVYLYAINVGIDLVKKFVDSNPSSK
jgi:hypothetical protein